MHEDTHARATYEDSIAFGATSCAVERPLGRAMSRGLRMRCPSCGTGSLLTGYLSVRDSCPACAAELHHHRADDGPAYLTILIVGHVVAPLLLWSFVTYRPDALTLATVFGVGTVALSLVLLPRLKGMFIAIQWAKRMGGFGTGPTVRPIPADAG